MAKEAHPIGGIWGSTRAQNDRAGSLCSLKCPLTVSQRYSRQEVRGHRPGRMGVGQRGAHGRTGCEMCRVTECP